LNKYIFEHFKFIIADFNDEINCEFAYNKVFNLLRGKDVLNPSSIVTRENICLRKFNRRNGQHWELQYEERVNAKILSFTALTLAKGHNVID